MQEGGDAAVQCAHIGICYHKAMLFSPAQKCGRDIVPPQLTLTS
jgi:hypothetical protein